LAPGIAINILKTGYLFLAAEGSNHGLYLFKSDGEDEERPTVCHSQQAEAHKSGNLPRFNPRELVNLELRDEMENLAPINDMKVDDLTNEG
jgi:splicing factor 3B subunit 3